MSGDYQEPDADVIAWLERHQHDEGWDFPSSVLQDYEEYGHLSDSQIEAVRRCMEREDRNLTDLDIRAIEPGIYGNLVIEHGEGKWAGWVFVNRRTGGKVGAQRPGERYRGKCADELRKLLQ